ncbi:transcriptional regulator FtsR [Janibacter corallicola]|uniref:transcriptional regulator FtsR n=1 Tax=Janibacter corallicola TaxID=415212 RepID=UPI000836D3CE|nr:MerR family transcriptional regulator [Janibacter corallicola]
MAAERIGIGALLKRLQPDFPDISISKIRFLESEGLVTPARTSSGYRKYSQQDIERLEFVLTAQRDRFWPLKVIRDRLDAVERGLDVDSDEGPVPPRGPGGEIGERLSAPIRPLRLTGPELQQAAGIDTDIFRELVSYGLLPKNREHFDAHDLEVATAAGALVETGIGVRHLRPLKSAAEREVGLTEHVLGQQALRGRAATEDGVDDATVVRTVVEGCLELHVALVRQQLDAQD